MTIYLAGSNKCFYWGNLEPLIVFDLQDLTSTHEFRKEREYLSCKWGQTIAYLDASGNWQQVNLSANAFQVLPLNGLMWHQRVKVQAFHFLCYCRFHACVDIIYVSFYKQTTGTNQDDRGGCPQWQFRRLN